jgi:hypothetical protein
MEEELVSQFTLAKKVTKRTGSCATLNVEMAIMESAQFAGNIAQADLQTLELIVLSLLPTAEVLDTLARVPASQKKASNAKNGVFFGTLNAEKVSITLLAVSAVQTVSMAKSISGLAAKN